MAEPSGEVTLIVFRPVINYAEVKYDGRYYAIQDGEWVDKVPNSAAMRKIKSAVSHILPKPPKKHTE